MAQRMSGVGQNPNLVQMPFQRHVALHNCCVDHQGLVSKQNVVMICMLAALLQRVDSRNSNKLTFQQQVTISAFFCLILFLSCFQLFRPRSDEFVPRSELFGSICAQRWVRFQASYRMQFTMTDRHEVKRKILNLIPRVSTDVLERVEKQMRENATALTLDRNPSGSNVVGPCVQCGGSRPPQLGSEPWHLRENSHGAMIPRGKLCGPCEWHKRNPTKTRSQWPHWAAFREHHANGNGLFKIPSHVCISRGAKRKHEE